MIIGIVTVGRYTPMNSVSIWMDTSMLSTLGWRLLYLLVRDAFWVKRECEP